VDVRALLWDVDGTLADTEMGGHRLAFNRAFEAAGLPWHWDTTTYGQLLAISGGRERIRHFFARAREGPVSEAEVETLMAAKQAAYADLARGGRLPLRPGVKRLPFEGQQIALGAGFFGGHILAANPKGEGRGEIRALPFKQGRHG